MDKLVLQSGGDVIWLRTLLKKNALNFYLIKFDAGFLGSHLIVEHWSPSSMVPCKCAECGTICVSQQCGCAHRGCCFCLPASRAPCGLLSAVSVRTAVRHHESTFHTFRAIKLRSPAVSSVRAVFFFLGCFFNQEMKCLKFHSALLLLLYCFSKSEAFVDALIWFDKLNQILHLSGDFLLYRLCSAYISDVCCSRCLLLLTCLTLVGGRSRACPPSL